MAAKEKDTAFRFLDLMQSIESTAFLHTKTVLPLIEKETNEEAGEWVWKGIRSAFGALTECTQIRRWYINGIGLDVTLSVHVYTHTV